MPLTMHAVTVPVFTRNLTNLLAWLDKAEAHAGAKRFDTKVYLGLRLAPDMLDFTKQIQIVSDTAKGCVARLAGVDVPKWDDTESSLDELRERIRRTLGFVQGFTAAQLDGSEARALVIPTRQGDEHYDGERFALHRALPNFYFHLNMAYALLRQAGVDLGKADYLK